VSANFAMKETKTCAAGRRSQVSRLTVATPNSWKAPATHALKIPDGLSALEAAPLFCAGLTVLSRPEGRRDCARSAPRCFRHRRPGTPCSCSSDGPLAWRCTAIDISEEKLELARSCGASDTLNATTTDAAKQLRRKGGIHVSLVTSAAKAAYDTAFSCLRPRRYSARRGLAR